MKITLYFIAIMFFFFACKKEDTELVEKAIKGSYGGQVSTLLYDNGDCKVEITDEKDYYQYTLTDSSGNFLFNNIPFGNYNVTYSKAGFGAKKEFNVYVSGLYNNYNSYIKLYPINQSTITSFDSIGIINNSYSSFIYFKMKLDTIRNPVILLVFSKSENCDIDHFDFAISTICSINRRTSLSQTYLPFNDIIELGAHKGDLLYVRMYPKDTGDNGYFDFLLNRKIFSTANTSGGSEVKSFTVPFFDYPY